jgi:hypothetical protein
MNIVAVKGQVMREVEALFNITPAVPREQIETMTRLTELSIPEAYYLETGDCIVKCNHRGWPSQLPGREPHTHYIRVKDMEAKQVVVYSTYIKSQNEGTKAWGDILLSQLDARKDKLLSGA